MCRIAPRDYSGETTSSSEASDAGARLVTTDTRFEEARGDSFCCGVGGGSSSDLCVNG